MANGRNPFEPFAVPLIRVGEEQQPLPSVACFPGGSRFGRQCKRSLIGQEVGAVRSGRCPCWQRWSTYELAFLRRAVWTNYQTICMPQEKEGQGSCRGYNIEMCCETYRNRYWIFTVMMSVVSIIFWLQVLIPLCVSQFLQLLKSSCPLLIVHLGIFGKGIAFPMFLLVMAS